jgi:hypothetical protein
MRWCSTELLPLNLHPRQQLWQLQYGAAAEQLPYLLLPRSLQCLCFYCSQSPGVPRGSEAHRGKGLVL